MSIMTYPNEAEQSEGWIEEGQILRFPKKTSEAKSDWEKSTVPWPNPMRTSEAKSES